MSSLSLSETLVEITVFEITATDPRAPTGSANLEFNFLDDSPWLTLFSQLYPPPKLSESVSLSQDLRPLLNLNS